MVKRAAETELTDRNWQDTDEHEVVQEGPMKRAAPQMIEKRQIRSLPRKPAGAAPAVSPMTFASFGSTPSAPSNPFASPKPTASSGPFSFGGEPPASHTSSPFGNMPATTTTTKTPFGSTFSSPIFGVKNVDSSISSAQFGAPEATSATKDNTASLTTFETSSSSPASKPSTETLTTYYASLRGLNLSAVSALDRVIQTDGFTNLDQVFDRLRLSYNKHRELIVKDFEANGGSVTDELSTTADKQSPNDLSNPAVNLSSPADQSVPDPKSSQSCTTQSTNSLEVKKDNNGINNHKANSRPGAFTTAAPVRPSPLRFETECDTSGSKTSAPPANENSTNPGPSFSTGSAFPTTAVKKPATTSFGSTTSSSKMTDPASSAVSNIFGSGPFSNLTSKPATTTFAGFTSTADPPASNTTPAKPSFAFGHGKSGSPGSAGNQFGGFGGSPKISETTPPKAGFNPVGFSFGATMSPPASSSAKPEVADAAPESSTTKPADTLPDESASGVEFVADKNEEDEDTVYETSGRVYAFTDKLQSDGMMKKQWVGWDVCSVKLNRNQNTLKTRLLARSKSNTKILVNFYFHDAMAPQLNGTTLKFTGFDKATPTLYMIRLTSVNEAELFEKAIKDVLQTT